MKKINMKSKKKRGFTLIEIISVIAIICILIVALLPKFNGYIIKAKKLAVISQARKVVMAVESYNMEASTEIGDTESIDDIVSSSAGQYLEEEDFNKLSTGMSLGDCRNIVNGDEFSIDNGVFSGMGITANSSETTSSNDAADSANGSSNGQ